jgi:hypothetical protein
MSQTEISHCHKEWAKLMRSRVGGNCEVKAYYDDPKQHKIHIFTSSNENGVLAATVGLMDTAMRFSSGVELRSEVIMDQRGHDSRLANILATIAFYVIKDGWKIAPGIVFEDMVRMYIPETELPHVMFVGPWQFRDLSRVTLSDRTIFPLVAVPISEAESELARANAGRDLEDLWQRKSTDVLDWARTSAI